MRKIVIILSILVLIASGCGQTTKKRAETNSIEIISEQEEYGNNLVENKKDNFRQIELDEKIGNRTLKEYLLDENIPQVFKDVFQQKQGLYDNDETFTLIDSLSSTDKERHPFYFVLATRAMWWSDGAFSEPLGMAIRKYVESNTKQFLAYFSTEVVLTQFDFQQWAKYTLYEILIDSDENIAEVENTRNLMRKNCKQCSSEKIVMIDKFIECVYAEYEEIQRSNKEWEKNNL